MKVLFLFIETNRKLLLPIYILLTQNHALLSKTLIFVLRLNIFLFFRYDLFTDVNLEIYCLTNEITSIAEQQMVLLIYVECLVRYCPIRSNNVQ
jgi:hypothetical protein